MKKVQKSQKTSLRVSSETLRALSSSDIAEVVGGSSNNGCTGTHTVHTACLACVF